MTETHTATGRLLTASEIQGLHTYRSVQSNSSLVTPESNLASPADAMSSQSSQAEDLSLAKAVTLATAVAILTVVAVVLLFSL